MTDAETRRIEAKETTGWEGWAHVTGSPKRHYFASGDNDGVSLCGRFQLPGKPEGLTKGDDASPENCYPCKSKLRYYRTAG